ISVAWRKVLLHDDVAGAVAMLAGSSPNIVLQRATLLEWQKKYREAIVLVESVPDTPENFSPEASKSGRLGILYLESGQEAVARPLLLEALKITRAISDK